MIRYGFNTACSAYKHRLEARPLQTKMLTSAALFSFGDYICQRAEATLCPPCKSKALSSQDEVGGATRNEGSLTDEKNDWWDSSRTIRQGMIGGMLLSPGLHFFLTRIMSRAVFPSLSYRANIGMRVAIHQACMMPFIQFTLLFLSAAMQPANSLQDRIAAGKKRFSDKWVTGFSASLMFWPVANTVMYSVVPLRFMNLYADMCSLFFATLMSYITYKDCSAELISERPKSRRSEDTTGWPEPGQTAYSAASMLSDSVLALPRVWQAHYLSLMLDGQRVEAQSAPPRAAYS